jgi:mono/diheme cytochrome c family protein
LKQLAPFLLILIGAISIEPSQADTLTERGNYLVNTIIACGSCHSPRGKDGELLAGMAFSGGHVITSPTFRAVTPNITSDAETGIGKWSESDLVNALRNGRRPDGTMIGPPMPIGAYRNISDQDFAAIVAYVRQIKPVNHRVERSTYRVPPPGSYGPPVASVPDVDRSNQIVYGRYLAATLADCMTCHTPIEKGRPDLARFGAGGREMEADAGGSVTTPNLTPGNEDGIVSWTDQQVKTVIREGRRPNGSVLVKLMPVEAYKEMSEADLDAIVAFVRSLKPVK